MRIPDIGYSMGALTALTVMLLAADTSAARQSAAGPAPPNTPPRSEASFSQADRLAGAGEFSRALAVLNDLSDANLDRSELLWRKAYVQIYLGKRAGNKSEARAYYRSALADAQAAIQADGGNAHAHAIHAMAAGRASLTAPTKRQRVRLSRQVKTSADRAIARDPELDIGYHVRGRWHYEIATLGFFTRTVVQVIYGGFPDASLDQAAADLTRAVELNDRIVHRLHLGIVYEALDARKQAIEQLERVQEMPARHPEDPTFREDARSRLADLR